MLHRQSINHLVTPESALRDMNDQVKYARSSNNFNCILIAIPWMTFGGEETLIYNYC